MFNSLINPVVHNHIEELIRLKRQAIKHNAMSLTPLLQSDETYLNTVRDHLCISLDLGKGSGKNTTIGRLATLQDVVLSESEILNAKGTAILSYTKRQIMNRALDYLPACPKTVYVNGASLYDNKEREFLFRKFGDIHNLFVFLG